MSAPLKKTAKVSCNNETATDTERHNSREMYEEGYENRDKNLHWDCYDNGSSFVAERKFYKDNFTKILEAQNERYLSQRHPERVMSMEQYHQKYMPQEMIFQIGDKELADQGLIDDSWCREAVQKVVDKLESVGCKVISWDLHNDETTPHVHLRYCPIDKEGKVNISNCLYENGVMPPDVSKLETRKNGKPKFERYNNPKQTLLNDIRAELEELGHEWCNQRGLVLDDQNRTKRKHQTVNEYKREQLRKDVVVLEDTIEEKQAEVESSAALADDMISRAAEASEAAKKANEEAALTKAELHEVKAEKEELEHEYKERHAELEASLDSQIEDLKSRYEESQKELKDAYDEEFDKLDAEYRQRLHDYEVQDKAASRHLEYIKGVADGHEERANKYQALAKERRHKAAIAHQDFTSWDRKVQTRKKQYQQYGEKMNLKEEELKHSDEMIAEAGNIDGYVEEIFGKFDSPEDAENYLSDTLSFSNELANSTDSVSRSWSDLLDDLKQMKLPKKTQEKVDAVNTHIARSVDIGGVVRIKAKSVLQMLQGSAVFKKVREGFDKAKEKFTKSKEQEERITVATDEVVSTDKGNELEI